MRINSVFGKRTNSDDDYGEYTTFDNVGLRDRLNEALVENRTIIISHTINQHDSATLVGLLLLLDIGSKERITLIINSPGGDIEGLTAIYDTMQLIESPISTICIGDASSSAAILLSAGTPGMRYISENSSVMIHQVQAGSAGGTTADVVNEAKATKKLNKRISEILARHTGQTYAKVSKDCAGDKYMNAKDALKYGIVDEILEPAKPIPPLLKKAKPKKVKE